MRPGADISTPTPAAENNARGLVSQGEGSHEVRVSWGLDSSGLPLYDILLKAVVPKADKAVVPKADKAFQKNFS